MENPYIQDVVQLQKLQFRFKLSNYRNIDLIHYTPTLIAQTL